MTDYMAKNTISDIVRVVFATLDRAVYTLMTILYEIFFSVATADLLGGEMIRNIYYRVQLILGVFMVFKLAVTILQGIVSPDAAFDKKGGPKNAGSVITRIIIALIMLTLIAPLNIPNPSNEWEKQINNNGILFGTLFSLQNRILENNTIGRIIMGTTDNASVAQGNDDLTQIGRTFSSTILKAFVRINVLPEIQQDPGEGKAPETLKANRVCKEIDNSILEAYTREDASPNQILSLVNLGCGRAENGTTVGTLWNETVQGWLGNEYYAFSYIPLIGTIVGIVIDFVLIAYSIDVAIRVFKLAILRIIAPIPIIGHMNISPKDAKGEGMFGLWTKALTSTYLELFIRLAIIYFVLYIVQNIMINGINFTFGASSFIINIFATVFIIVGLMLFANQAPNYIKSVLGIKSAGSAGLNLITTMAGNLRGGNDLQKSWEAAREAVAVKNFGDKENKGHGTFYNTAKAAADKIGEKNDKNLEREFYRRSLDMDDYSYIADDGTTVYGLDASQRRNRWWQTEDANKNLSAKNSIAKNTTRYDSRRRMYDPADGRGITARSGNTNQTSTYTPPTTYYQSRPDGKLDPHSGSTRPNPKP